MRIFILSMILMCSVGHSHALAWGWGKSKKEEVHVGERLNKIIVKGFLLKDTKVYQQLNKKYQQQYFTDTGIKNIVEELEAIYREKGYIGLVDSTYTFKKGVLTIRMNLSKQ